MIPTYLDLLLYLSGFLNLFTHYQTQQVKSVLDPCEDENNENQDDEISLEADSLQKDEDSEYDTEVIAFWFSSCSDLWFL